MLFTLLFYARVVRSICFVSLPDELYAQLDSGSWDNERVNSARSFCSQYWTSEYAKFTSLATWDLSKETSDDIPIYLGRETKSPVIPIDKFVDRKRESRWRVYVGVEPSEESTGSPVVPVLETSQTEFGVCPPAADTWGYDDC